MKYTMTLYRFELFHIQTFHLPGGLAVLAHFADGLAVLAIIYSAMTILTRLLFKNL